MNLSKLTVFKRHGASLAVYILVALTPGVLFANALERYNTLTDFTSDGCSMSPDGAGTEINKLLDCCVEHDIKYWHGGSREDRLAADVEFRECVKVNSNSAIAEVYYRAVRAAGSNRWSTPFRWGFGWKRERGYRPLSPREVKIINEKLEKVDWDQIYNGIFLGNVR